MFFFLTLLIQAKLEKYVAVITNTLRTAALRANPRASCPASGLVISLVLLVFFSSRNLLGKSWKCARILFCALKIFHSFLEIISLII